MKILVTGGAGFIGSNFILYWLKRHPEDEVVNLDVLTYAGNLLNLKEVENQQNYRFVKGDITDTAAVTEAMRGVETVVHFAAESHVDRSILEPAAFVKTNVLGTQVLLDAALKLGVKRFHHISTDEVFGSLELGSDQKFNEETPYRPCSPYSASKAGSDMLVRAYAHTYGLPVTISNCSNNYGPFQFPEKLIPLMLMNALADQPLPVYGDGLNVRDWIYVEDHCRAIELILAAGRIGETYCVGGHSEMANIDVVKELLKTLGKPERLIRFVKDRPGHDRRYAIDDQKIRDELGYRPAHTFEEGLRATIDWYRENEEWVRQVMDKEYQQYYQQQYGEKGPV
ncbi:dTDP-glucose 4,6-dehydratase [Patescibacteria group bacterium]|nr:dTDP-glucose 4,6-dehydratase [Patescibacteria group bacterium]